MSLHGLRPLNQTHECSVDSEKKIAGLQKPFLLNAHTPSLNPEKEAGEKDLGSRMERSAITGFMEMNTCLLQTKSEAQAKLVQNGTSPSRSRENKVKQSSNIHPENCVEKS